MFDRKRAERLARQGLHAVKRRARRRDLLGEATYRTLSAVHDGLGTAADGLERLAKASEPPARAGARGRAQAPRWCQAVHAQP
jgi:hypothetical protein